MPHDLDDLLSYHEMGEGCRRAASHVEPEPYDDLCLHPLERWDDRKYKHINVAELHLIEILLGRKTYRVWR